jgi:heme exporter protein B
MGMTALGREWQRAWAVARKDLLIERRAKAAFNAMAFFAGLVLLTFGFALGPDVPAGEARQGTLLQALAPGLIWVTILFAGVLALDRSFQVELERGGLDALRLYPGDRKAIYLGKLIANVTIMLIMEALVCPFAGILYSLDLWTRLPGLAGVAILTTTGFAAMGTFYAALTANLRARQVLLPLLMFPVLIPVILAAVKATTLVLHGDPMGELGSWVKLLGAVDILFLTTCLLVFEYVLEE